MLRVLAHVVLLSQLTTRPLYILLLYLPKIKSPPLVKYATRNNIYDLGDMNEYSIWAPRLRMHKRCIRQQNSRDVISIVVCTPNARRHA